MTTPSMQRPPTIKMGPFQALHLKSCLQVSISMARLCQGVRKIFVSVIVKGMAKRTMFLSVIKFYNSICLERSQKQLCPRSKGLTTISQICSPHHSLFAFLQLHYFSVQFQSISVGATTSTDPKYVCFPLSITYISLIFPF